MSEQSDKTELNDLKQLLEAQQAGDRTGLDAINEEQIVYSGLVAKKMLNKWEAFKTTNVLGDNLRFKHRTRGWVVRAHVQYVHMSDPAFNAFSVRYYCKYETAVGGEYPAVVMALDGDWQPV